jgi:periplasmic divalent cation tolerance protein
MVKKTRAVVVYATFPDLNTAKKIIRGLVKAQLAACGNIFRLTSIYAWRGRIEDSPEYGALIKTVRKNYRRAEQYIKRHHPYEVPEIISWNIERGSQTYRSWILNSVL